MNFSEDNIRELLLAYVNAEMDSIIPENMPGYDHVYSRRYKRRIKKIMWSEKYFGTHLKLGYAVRYVAAFVAIIGCLYLANEVSAKVFGINPWKTIVSFFADSEVNHKTYSEPAVAEGVEYKTVVRDIPLNVPDGFEAEIIRDSKKIKVTWNNRETEQVIKYIRSAIDYDIISLEDATYQSVSDISIAGYKGRFCSDEKRMWIQWEDISYNHYIEMSDVVYLETVIDMADSLYE